MRKKHFTKQVGLILSEETYDQLIEQTNRKEVTISEWIREAIENKMVLEKSVSTLSKDRKEQL